MTLANVISQLKFTGLTSNVLIGTGYFSGNIIALSLPVKASTKTTHESPGINTLFMERGSGRKNIKAGMPLLCGVH